MKELKFVINSKCKTPKPSATSLASYNNFRHSVPWNVRFFSVIVVIYLHPQEFHPFLFGAMSTL